MDVCTLDIFSTLDIGVGMDTYGKYIKSMSSKRNVVRRVSGHSSKLTFCKPYDDVLCLCVFPIKVAPDPKMSFAVAVIHTYLPT